MQRDSFFVGFIDVAFLKRQGAAKLGVRADQVQPDAGAVVTWLRSLGKDAIGSDLFLRAYWYDGQFEAGHANRKAQDGFFDAIGLTPGIQLRLGHVSENKPKFQVPITKALEATAKGLGIPPADLANEFANHWTWTSDREQKGVDTRIVMDMVRLAKRDAFTTGILLAGDRDLAEAVREAQDEGCRIVVAAPALNKVAKELKQLADVVVDLNITTLRSMLVPPARSTSRAAPRASTAKRPASPGPGAPSKPRARRRRPHT